MKKIIALVLVLVMIIGCVSAVAEETAGYKTALLLVKERIGNTDEYDRFNGYTNTNEGGTNYRFQWENNNGSLSVVVTESGIITGYNRYERDKTDDAPISKHVSRNVAQKNALAWLSKINPDISDKILITGCSGYDGMFTFEIAVTHNGFMIDNNRGYISIDAVGDNVTRFNLTYTEGKSFEEGEVIDDEDAKSVYKEKIGFELQYISDWDNDYNRSVKPVYLPVPNKSKYVSAVTGEIIDIETPEEIYKGSNAVFESAYAADSSEAGGFTQAELEEFEKIELTISRKKAVDVIKNCKYFNLPKEAFDNYSISTYSIDDESRGYRINFKWDSFYAGARVNAEDGTILSFSKSVSEGEPVLTEEEATQTADEAFEYIAPNIYGEYRPGEDYGVEAIPYDETQKPKTETFTYYRYVNDIPFYDNAVNVSVDLADNSVIGFNQYHSFIDFPSVDNVVAYDDAAEEYFNKVGFIPVYILDDDQYRLVYKLLETRYFVDAITGKINMPLVVEEYSDVSCHYGEVFVNSLLQLGIGFDSELLKPDEPIKQKEFAALLLECIRYNGYVMLDDGYGYESLYEYGVPGIIEDENEHNPDGNVTRLDAAKFTVCAMGYSEIGKLDVYRPMFSDMEHAGYASILCGLGIMNGDGNGNFNPDAVLTRAQALIMIYNYLNR